MFIGTIAMVFFCTHQLAMFSFLHRSGEKNINVNIGKHNNKADFELLK